MIKFFRKIRQRLLTENKFSKYLIYAIGEIILVVIGILIALQVNTINEAKKNEKAIAEILRNMLNELNTDINLYNDILLNFYQEKDSLIYLILNSSLTEKDYSENTDLAFVETFFKQAKPLTNSYKQFTGYFEKMPDRFKPLISEISYLYDQQHVGLERYNRKMNDVVWGNIDFREKYNWFTLPFPNKPAIEFYLNNIERLNKVYSWNIYQRNHIYYIHEALLSSRSLCLKIADALDKPASVENFNTRKELINNWVGKYTSKSNSIDSFRIIEKKGDLYVLKNQDTSSSIILPINKTKGFVFSNQLRFLTLAEDNGNIVIKNNKAKWLKEIE